MIFFDLAHNEFLILAAESEIRSLSHVSFITNKRTATFS